MNKSKMTQRDIKKIDKTILDNFYKLVHSQPNVRLTAASSTYKILTGLKKKHLESFNEHLNYCIERLVTGLASSRALARRGYGTLLLELLNNYQVSTDRLLTIAQTKFGQISNETTRDNLLGYFLLISIILKSSNYKKGKSNQYVEKIYKYLIQLKNIKSYFDYPVSKVLRDYHALFHPFLLADVPPHAFGSDTKVTHTQLLIIVLCNKKEPLKQLADIDNVGLMNLASALRDDRLQRRPLHPVIVEFCQFVADHRPEQFQSFCSDVIFPTLFKQNHNELASMGLELISTLLDSTKDPKVVKTLLSDYIIRLLILSLRSRNSLHKHCVEFFKSLNTLFEKLSKEEDSYGGEKQFLILDKLTGAPGSVAFDDDSKSCSINSLLNSASSHALIKYLNKLMELLSREFKDGIAERIHNACARQMSHIIKRPQMSEELATTLRLAKFLLVNSFFVPSTPQVQDKSFWESHCIPQPLKSINDSTRVALKSAYHATMEHLVSTCNTLQRIEQMNELIDYCNQLDKSKSLEYADKSSEVDRNELWKHYMSSLNGHRKFIKKLENSKPLYPITSLFLFYGLQIVEHSLDCKSQLEELEQSSQEALKEDPNDGSWADVLTDQIIAILSATECSPWIRKLCISIFGSLLPHISEMSIDLLCDALKSPLNGEAECSDEEEDGSEMDVTDEDEDTSERPEDDNEDEDEDDDEEGDEDEDENSSDDDESEDEEEVSDTSKDDVEMSVSDTAQHLDRTNDDDGEGESEEEYLDDEQMMKLDSVIGDMFKLNRVGKKKRRDPSFKLRCLDLVKKVLVKKHNDAVIIDRILATIVPLAAKSQRSAETRAITDKINTMIAKIPGKSKLMSSKPLN